MDFENHKFSCVLKKRKNAHVNRKVKLSISYKAFDGFKPMEFAHVRFPPSPSQRNH